MENSLLLDGLARLVTTHRIFVLVALAIITGVLGFQIPAIRVDPSVENLISSYEGNESSVQNAARFERDFGDTDRVMLLLVQSENVLQQRPLQYLHDTTRFLAEQDWIESVISLTQTPLPRRVHREPEEDSNDLGFDQLEAELFGEEEEYTGEEDFDPEVVDALVTLCQADPERFPGGFSTLGPQLALELKTNAIVEGAEVRQEHIEELKSVLVQSSLLSGRLVSEDRTLAVTALFINETDTRKMRERVSELRRHLVEHPPPEGVDVRLGGLPYLRSAIVENIRSDQIMLVPLTLVVCLLILAITLRWFPGVILPIVAVGITALMVVGGMAFFGEPMNILNNIIPTLLIIIGISDSIHLIGRYREEWVQEEDRFIAGRRTVRAMAVACLLTSATTSVGLASLIVSRTVMLRHFGITSALGVMVAYFVTILFLPSVLTWVRAPSKESIRRASGWLEVGIMRMTVWVLRRPWKIIAAATMTLGAATWIATQLHVDHALLDQFDEEDPLYQTTQLLEEKLDGVRPLEVSLRSETPGRFLEPDILNQVDQIAAWAREDEAVLATMSQTTILKQSLSLLANDSQVVDMPFRNREQVQALHQLLRAREGNADPLNAWVDASASHMRFQIKVRDVGAQATMKFIDNLKERFERAEIEDVDVAFTGEAYDGSVGMEAIVGDLLYSLLTAILIIFLLLALLFRSVRLGLLSIPPNIIPLIFTMAYMVIRDIPLNAATVIIFSISLGLAVDGSIHVLARFREETRIRGFLPHAALIRSARGTGRAIVVSCVTLMAGFSVLLASNFVPVRRFGELIAVTVAGCLFATLVVQPALLRIAGTSSKEKESSVHKSRVSESSI